MTKTKDPSGSDGLEGLKWFDEFNKRRAKYENKIIPLGFAITLEAPEDDFFDNKKKKNKIRDNLYDEDE
jgi:hypothetical protein